MEKVKETLLSKIYYNPKHEATFGGLEKLSPSYDKLEAY